MSGWRTHMLRWLARGLRARSGEPLDTKRTIRTLDRIADDPQLSARFDGLSENEVRDAFLDLYEED